MKKMEKLFGNNGRMLVVAVPTTTLRVKAVVYQLPGLTVATDI
jgi:hypothetical protein